MDITARLDHCISLSQQKEKVDAFRTVLESILSSPSSSSLVAHLQDYVKAVLDEQVGLVIARQLLTEFMEHFDTQLKDHQVQKQVLSFAIERAQPRVVSFEELLSQLREKLATIYEQEEDFLEAAKILQGIALDSGHRSISDDYKLQIYIRIVRLLLEEDEAGAAEMYLNRAGLLILDSSDLVLNLTFKLSQARILDAKHRFLEACTRYHELSYVTQLDEDEQIQCLTAAVQCAVLAGAGPQRSRILATLYKDERTHHLSSFSVLEKTYLDRVIRANEVSDFALTLKPHHLARLADNTTTVFDRAMIEHNLVSASKIYNNITFAELGSLLNVSPEEAEHVAAHMIGENRLGGSMDQLDQLITFIPLSDLHRSLQPTTAATTSTQHQQKHVEQSMQAIMNWDQSIQAMCGDLDTIIGVIQERYPDYVAEHYRHFV